MGSFPPNWQILNIVVLELYPIFAMVSKLTLFRPMTAIGVIRWKELDVGLQIRSTGGL